MDSLFIPSLIGALMIAGAAACALHWLRTMTQARAARLREQGHRFIHALNAYSAWVDCQRDLPFTSRSLDELTSPAPLTLARKIKRDSFPSLSRHMLAILQAHSRMVEYLWQQNLLRLSQGAGWQPAHRDPAYLELRCAQEELIADTVAACRDLIGEERERWHRTASDFSFSSGWSPHEPAGRG